MISSSLPYFEAKAESGNILKILVDTGSSKNYIRPELVRKRLANMAPFYVRSVVGDIRISEHTYVKLFGIEKGMKFYLMTSLDTFDGILGNDTLREIGATIYTAKDFMILGNGLKVKLKQLPAKSVNAMSIEQVDLSTERQEEMRKIASAHPRLFSEPDEKLTYTTKVVGEIRTTTDTPVYTKFYPYPASLKSEVENQVKKLLNDGIIRPSRSPFNSPVWIVPKKPDSAGNKQYRMVIDYRKLNSITIADRYPIPEISEVISQLGSSNFFSVIDLKSGFHQIPLKETDIEKTAFSINNGKYEFTRLPFGLKNAPSIFQRALDDILREFIGRCCYVYIDDIIIFSKSENEHFEHIGNIFKTLEEANMKVQLDKCNFFKKEVEFLGYIITPLGIKTNPEKVRAIENFPQPQNLKELRSFLGMSGYYRRFIKDYSKLAKPLTSLLRGEGGRTPKSKSAKLRICLDEEAKESFRKIKNSLTSEDIILAYPDYSKDFELVTDASNFAIGAVLSQSGRPISFISRTLNKAEEHYAANEKEMLAIIWALNSLRNYLYGSARVKIFTDHQPLTYALSNKNNNSKMKRWKSILEEYNYELFYKPGRTNVVADALSRIPEAQLYTLSVATNSDESSSHNLIYSVETPINAFKNQIFLNRDAASSYQFKIVFPTYHRHIITEQDYGEQQLIEILKRYLNPSVINCIKTEENIMGKIQEIYPLHFEKYRIRFTQVQVDDITNEEEQENIIIRTHNRAHRNCRENRAQILERYYFPSMARKIKNLIKKCIVCKENKYDRHPAKPQIQATPIPQFPGQIVHLDIFLVGKELVLTAIDKFSKYAIAKPIKSKATEDIRQPLRDILFSFVPETLVMDNEKSFNSESIKFMIENEFGIQIFRTAPYTSCSNGQVERFHSTLQEIMRCLQNERTHRSFQELLDRSVKEYNFSVHSVTGKRPMETFFGRRVSSDPRLLEKDRNETIKKLSEKQMADLAYHNRDRSLPREYAEGEIVFVKLNRRLGNKLSARYQKEIVAQNYNTTVKTKSGKIVHKNNIKLS